MVRLKDHSRSQIPLFFLVVLFPPFCFFLLVNFWLRPSIEKEIRSRQSVIADSKLQQIESYIQERKQNATALAHNPELQEILRSGGSEGKRGVWQYLRAYPIQYGFESLILILRNGEPVSPLSPSAKSPIPMDDNIKAVYESARTLMGTELSSFNFDTENVGSIAYVASPVFDAQGFIGGLVLKLSGREIAGVLGEDTGLGKTGEIIVGARGKKGPVRLLFSNNGNLKTYEIPQDSPLLRALKGERGQGLVIDEQLEKRTKREVLATWRYIPSLQWAIAIQMEAAEVFAPLKNFGIVSGVGLIALMLGGFVIYRTLVKARNRAESGTRQALIEEAKAQQAAENERQARTRERQAIMLRNQMASLISHNLGNPASSIRSNGEDLVELLTSNESSFEENRIEAITIANDIASTAKRLQNRVKRLFDPSRIEKLEWTHFNLGDLIGEIKQQIRDAEKQLSAMKRLEISSSQPSYDLKIEGANSGGFLWADREALREVLVNLIENSIKYGYQQTSATGTINANLDVNPLRSAPHETVNQIHLQVLRVEETRGTSSEWVELRITDQGIGIPHEKWEEIFRPGGRLNPRQVEGTGLGLAGSREFCEKMGGSLAVEWSEPGRGSCFLARLPADRVIRVGILHSTEGTMGISEEPVLKATRLAIAELNKEGGIELKDGELSLAKRIIGIEEDGKSDSQTFADAAERLIINEKVSAIFGCWTSASRKAVIDRLEQEKKREYLLFYPVQYEGLEQSPNIIYTGAAPNQQIIPAVKWCFEELNATRFFLVGSDYVFPHIANKIIRREVEKLGGMVTGESYLLLDSPDVQETVDAILKTDPDVILNTINGYSNIYFFKKLRELGVTPRHRPDLFDQLKNKGLSPREIPTISFSIAEPEFRRIGIDEMAGDYAVWNYFENISDSTENVKFIDAISKGPLGLSAISDPMEAAYFGVRTWAKAVAEANSDHPADVIKKLRGMEFTAPEGKIKIDPDNQHCWKTVRIGQMDRETGKFKVLDWLQENIRPEPYPQDPQFRKELQEYSEKLYLQWNRHWENAGPQPSGLKVS